MHTSLYKKPPKTETTSVDGVTAAQEESLNFYLFGLLPLCKPIASRISGLYFTANRVVLGPALALSLSHYGRDG